jgi:phosphatidylinositol alpha 1,6-mannosyltransferase
VPVVAARATGAVDLIADGVDGYLVAPTDVAGYADAIERIVADSDLMRRLGESGHAKAASYRWDTANQAVLDTYLDLMKNRARCPS